MKLIVYLTLSLGGLYPLQEMTAVSQKPDTAEKQPSEHPLIIKAKKEFEGLLFKFLTAAAVGNVTLLQKCIKARADILDFPLIDSSGEAFFMALHLACEEGQLEIVKALLDAGAQVDPRDHKGRTPLFIAADKGYTKIVQLLIEHEACIDARSIFDVTPLHAASWAGHLDTINLLITKGANIHAECSYDSLPFLYSATYYGYLDIVKAFVQKGANSNITDPVTGSTLLHLVAYHDYADEELIKMLLERSANINAKDKSGMTPLFIAVYKKHKEVAALLTKYGGDMNGRPYPAS